MQPNKSVEEIEQIIKYFRGRTGGWGMVLDKSILEIEEDLRKNIQELLTSHTNTVLQGVVLSTMLFWRVKSVRMLKELTTKLYEI